MCGDNSLSNYSSFIQLITTFNFAFVLVNFSSQAYQALSKAKKLFTPVGTNKRAPAVIIRAIEEKSSMTDKKGEKEQYDSLLQKAKNDYDVARRIKDEISKDYGFSTFFLITAIYGLLLLLLCNCDTIRPVAFANIVVLSTQFLLFVQILKKYLYTLTFSKGFTFEFVFFQFVVFGIFIIYFIFFFLFIQGDGDIAFLYHLSLPILSFPLVISSLYVMTKMIYVNWRTKKNFYKYDELLSNITNHTCVVNDNNKISRSQFQNIVYVIEFSLIFLSSILIAALIISR